MTKALPKYILIVSQRPNEVVLSFERISAEGPGRIFGRFYWFIPLKRWTNMAGQPVEFETIREPLRQSIRASAFD